MAAHELLVERMREVVAGRCPEVPSPCISVCRMDPASELCEGCWRTLDEIAAWGGMGEQDKREVWKQIGRRIALQPLQEPGERKLA
jgi:predicted Fe-S protein YdhL (DUF1289 family)